MWKIVLLALVVGAVALSWPRYNLYEKHGTWSDKYHLREKGFWSKEACEAAGKNYDDPCKCLETSTWDDIWGSPRVYQE